MTEQTPKPKKPRKQPAAAADDPKRPPGRPAGVGNAAYAEAVAIPAVCPKCKSPDLIVVPGSKSIERPELVGKLANGVKYRGVEWKSMKCKCGQRVKVRYYFPQN